MKTWVIWSEQPPWILVCNSYAIIALMLVIYWHSLRHCQFCDGDRQGLALMIGNTSALLILPFIYRQAQGVELTEYRPSLFPIMALICAVNYFVQGSIFLGGCYLVGVGLVIAAFIMRFVPYWSPLILGLYLAAFHMALGIYLMRLIPAPDSSSPRPSPA